MAPGDPPARTAQDTALGRGLVLDELLDLTLYQELLKTSQGDMRKILSELIPVETTHCAFWQDFFGIKADRLDWGRRLKLRVLVGICRVFGETAVHLVLEAIEIYGIRKYLALWERYREEPLGQAVREVLEDEFRHEDSIVSQATARKIDPERIRSMFLGFNDGLVEILGAVSGFFAAFRDPGTVLMAAASVAVAGSLSMAAGAYVASSSEKEIHKAARGKARFLGELAADGHEARPLSAALTVGITYFVGATVPVLPVVFGAGSMAWPLAAAAAMIVVVSLVLAFLSGMDVSRRIALNLVIIAAAVGITYVIGMAAKSVWGISL